jgi:hypothetical protein
MVLTKAPIFVRNTGNERKNKPASFRKRVGNFIEVIALYRLIYPMVLCR